MMRILIVGATGTIGKAIVAALKGEHDIVAASRKSARHPGQRGQPAVGDRVGAGDGDAGHWHAARRHRGAGVRPQRHRQ